MTEFRRLQLGKWVRGAASVGKGRRFLLFPGHVYSENDGQVHFVGTRELLRLYRIPGDAEWRSAGPRGEGLLGVLEEPRDVLLGPRRDGDYDLARAIERSDAGRRT
jgi:hypothetical protein